MSPDPDTPFGHTVFCDDIRQEIGDKLSLMGVYAGKMLLGYTSLPTLLPKLALLVTYRQGHHLERLPVTFRIAATWQEAPLVQWTVSEWPDEAFNKPPEEDSWFLTLGFPVTLPSLIIPSRGKIKVRCFRANKEIRLGSLEIDAVSVPEPNPTSVYAP